MNDNTINSASHREAIFYPSVSEIDLSNYDDAKTFSSGLPHNYYVSYYSSDHDDADFENTFLYSINAKELLLAILRWHEHSSHAVFNEDENALIYLLDYEQNEGSLPDHEGRNRDNYTGWWELKNGPVEWFHDFSVNLNFQEIWDKDLSQKAAEDTILDQMLASEDMLDEIGVFSAKSFKEFVDDNEDCWS